MPILTLVNNVLPEIGLGTLTSLVGNTNQTAQRTLALCNREGKSLAKMPWRILSKRNVITTASSAESYALPSDFEYFVDDTFWNTSTIFTLEGPLSDQRWQADISGLLTVTVNDRFQIRADGNANRLFIRPVPTSAENITFFYMANSWCRSNGGQRQSSISADTDEVLIDNYVFELGIKWRILQAQRRSFETELAEYDREKKKAFARDGGMKSLKILGPYDIDYPPRGNIPETGFGS